jgi:uncharacterized damage-inducible protein DinB
VTTEQAVFLREFLLPSIEMEFGATSKVLAAVPDGEAADYRPDPKSRTARELAWHIVESDIQFFDAIANLKFDFSGDGQNPTSNSAALVAFYEEGFRKGVARIRALTPEQLSTPVDFLGAFKFPAVSYLTLLSNHTIHHRGQLSSYLRAMGSKVPAIYGPSADESNF